MVQRTYIVLTHGAKVRFRGEAEEVMRCLRAGLLESPRMPLDETVAVHRTLEA